jgi:DnaK suppressor protein
MAKRRALRASLEARLYELETRAERIGADLAEPLSADSEEQAVETEDDAALVGQESLIADRIVSVRAAIQRIDNGTYGNCFKCGGAIAPARLAVLPEATLCIDCARSAQTEL